MQILEEAGLSAAVDYLTKNSIIGKVPTAFVSVFFFEMYIKLPQLYQMYASEELTVSNVEAGTVPSGGMFGEVPVITSAEAYRKKDACDQYILRIVSTFPLKRKSLLQIICDVLKSSMIDTLLIAPSMCMEHCVMCEICLVTDCRICFRGKNDDVFVINGGGMGRSPFPNTGIADIRDVDKLAQSVGDWLEEPLSDLHQKFWGVFTNVVQEGEIVYENCCKIHKSCSCSKCYLLKLMT